MQIDRVTFTQDVAYTATLQATFKDGSSGPTIPGFRGIMHLKTDEGSYYAVSKPVNSG